MNQKRPWSMWKLEAKLGGKLVTVQVDSLTDFIQADLRTAIKIQLDGVDQWVAKEDLKDFSIDTWAAYQHGLDEGFHGGLLSS